MFENIINSRILDKMFTNTGKSLTQLGDRPIMLVFLRQFNCIFCREALSEISNERKEIEALIKELRKIKSTRTSESLDLISSKYLNKLCSAFETEKKRNKNSFDITLSSRELDTLKLIAENLTNQEIADKLFISLNTVKSHLKNINLKLEASNRSHAVTRAKEIGLI